MLANKHGNAAQVIVANGNLAGIVLIWIWLALTDSTTVALCTMVENYFAIY